MVQKLSAKSSAILPLYIGQIAPALHSCTKSCTMKAFHLYKVKRKTSPYIPEILPLKDMQVSKQMFEEYEEQERITDDCR